MRRTLLSGLLLVAAAFLTVLVGDWLDLELDDAALLGVAAGAVVALVPHATIGRRLTGFAFGVVLTLVGYLVRAALLPDTAGGRAAFAAIVVALCVVVAAVSMERLALWSTLLGAATFAGAFEATYTLAPPRVLENSISSLTAVAMCVAIGFCAAALGTPQQDRNTKRKEAASTNDEVLEGSK
jgi:hypothetical protein